MYLNKKIAVIIPAHNEEESIEKVILKVPDFIDNIIVVDDNSLDDTAEKVKALTSRLARKLLLIRHTKNQGVGAAIVSGYKKSIEMDYDISCVMAGDGQMDARELELLVKPIAANEADYTKGNRFKFSKDWRKRSKVRYFGSLILSQLTKFVSGYWHISDSQSGYTAVKNEILKRIDLLKVYKSYGYPNDLLVKFNVINCRVKDISVTPLYNIDGRTGMNFLQVIPSLSWLLIRGFFWRITNKYIVPKL
jgi:glycosyltransferase involved in cell wall biosynthesis